MNEIEEEFKKAYEMMIKDDSLADEKQEMSKLLMKPLDDLNKDEIKRLSYLQHKLQTPTNQ